MEVKTLRLAETANIKRGGLWIDCGIKTVHSYVSNPKLLKLNQMPKGDWSYYLKGESGWLPETMTVNAVDRYNVVNLESL